MTAAALEVSGLVVHDTDARRPRRVDGLDLAVAKGEIVGLFGLLGAGCGEAALAHLRRLAGPRRGRRSASTARSSPIAAAGRCRCGTASA